MLSRTYDYTNRFRSDFQTVAFKADIYNRIMHVNERFLQTSGYKERELEKRSYSVLRHTDMPQIIFELILNRLQKNQEISAYIKNFCNDGSFYWILSNLKPRVDRNGMIIDYSEVKKRPSENAMKIIPNLYRMLLISENYGGVASSKKMLDNLLKEHGMDYNDFVQFLQN